MALFKHAPLPFQGQKSKWFNRFSEIMDTLDEMKGNNRVCVVDVFGGSGLLSHWAKRLKPHFDVIYNDFDNYSNRLAHVHETNELIIELNRLFGRVEKNTLLNNEETQQLQQLLESKRGQFVDSICLSSWFKFSGTQVSTFDELCKLNKYYMKIPIKPYNESDISHYLDGITVIHEDASVYDEFQNKLKEYLPQVDRLIVFYILDPPYLYCDKTGYRQSYFKLESSINLVDYFLHDSPFMFFNSSKSGFFEFITCLKKYIPSINLNLKRFDKEYTTNKNTNISEYVLIFYVDKI